MLALMSPSKVRFLNKMQDCLRANEKNVYFPRVIKTSPLALQLPSPQFLHRLPLLIIDAFPELAVIENWIDKIYMFTDEISDDIDRNVDNKIHKYVLETSPQ